MNNNLVNSNVLKIAFACGFLGYITSSSVAAEKVNSVTSLIKASANSNYNAQSSKQDLLITGAIPVNSAKRAITSSNKMVKVELGDTLYSISRQYKVNVKKLIAVNAFEPPYNIKAGQTIKLPIDGSNNVGGSVTTASLPHSESNIVESDPVDNTTNISYNVHSVQAGDTLYSLSRNYGLTPQKIADYNDLAAPFTLQIGQKVKIPIKGEKVVAIKEDNNKQPTIIETSARYTNVPVPQEKPGLVVSNSSNSISNTTLSTSATGKFRWPVRGKIISRFGAKPNGARNDGVNISVPEGTSVRASAAGKVAYAGNELKGYGNLILIRHPDNWVTAYAHTKEMLVQRGDVVRRGQVIAKAGRTGSVKTPQLHFEIRKEADAVDPLKYMTTMHASN